MTREDYERRVRCYLDAVHEEAMRRFDLGTPAPLCLAFAQHRIYENFVRGDGELLKQLIPPSLIPVN
jgi:hypothetical protein